MMKKFTLIIALLLSFLVDSNAQVSLSQGFDASTVFPAGWTNPNFYGVSAVQACSGNSARKNLYEFAATSVLTTPNYAAASNGTDIAFSFDYKIVDWSAATAATAAGWGSCLVEMSTDAGVTWVTKYTIDDTNHVVANTCATVSFVIPATDVPTGSDVQFRFSNTWLAGDYYFYLDNISATQVTFFPPNCDATLTSPANGAIDVPIGQDLVWAQATGAATGYNLTIGTLFPGNDDILATTNVGNVTFYALPNLMFDTTYYVSIVPFNANGDAVGCTEYSFTTIPPPAPGNLCENAISVSLPYTTTGDTVNFSDVYYEGSPGATGCGTTSGYLGGNDVVYSYTATTTGSINLQMTTTQTFSGMFIYSSCASIGTACIGGGGNSGTGGVSIPQFAVTAGQTYYIVLSTWPAPQTMTYTLDITQNTCTNATATYATVSNCNVAPEFFVNVDVTSLGSAFTLTLTDDQGSGPQFAFGTGIVTFGPYANGTPVIITTVNDQDASCTLTSPVQNQLVCPPANDNCIGAFPVVVNPDASCAIVVAGTVAGATASPVDAVVCGGTEDDDVWFSFVATETSHRISLLNIVGSTTDLYHSLWTGADCASLTLVPGTCSDPNESTPTNLTIGTTYYLRVYTWTATTGQNSSFNVCIGTLPPPPTNSLCADAIDLGTLTSPITGTTFGATNNFTSATCNTTGTAPDIFYSILVPNGSTLTIGQPSNTYDSVNSLFYGDCMNQTQITCFDDLDTEIQTWVNNTGADQTVYWVQDGFNTGSGEFTLAWTLVGCANAEATYNVVSDCDNAPGFFVEVDVTDLGTATSLTISDNQMSATQPALALGTFTFGPYTNGTSVEITIVNDQNAVCTTTSQALTQAVCPPDCATATVLSCDTEVVANFVAGPGAWDITTCWLGGTPGTENLYSFTAPVDGDYSCEVISSNGEYIDYLYKEATGTCDETGWNCIQDIFEPGIYPMGTLTAGTTYFILLDSEETIATSNTFKVVCPAFCIPPVAEYTVVSNCNVAAEFFVDVNVTDLGNATTLSISDNLMSTAQTGLTTGIATFGPYANGTSVIFTVLNEQDATCFVTSTAQTQTDCPAACATLLTPADMATNVVFVTPGVVSLTWQAPVTGPAPVDYTIMWGNSITSMVSLGNTANLGANITNVPYNTTFYWSAVPNFATGSVTDCSVFSFTTESSPGFCLNGALWPAATFVPTCTSAPELIIATGWAGEYSNVTVTSGTEYTFTSSIATDFITIGDAAGANALGFGVTPLTWTSTVDGNIRFYTHTSDQCGTEQVDRARSITCMSLANDTFDNANFNAYPNPVKNILNLSYNKEITSVSIFNLIGQQVSTKVVNANTSQIDMSALPTGTYMVKVTSDAQVKTLKVVKE